MERVNAEMGNPRFTGKGNTSETPSWEEAKNEPNLGYEPLPRSTDFAFGSRSEALVSALSVARAMLVSVDADPEERKVRQKAARQLLSCMKAWEYVHAGDLIPPRAAA